VKTSKLNRKLRSDLSTRKAKAADDALTAASTLEVSESAKMAAEAKLVGLQREYAHLESELEEARKFAVSDSQKMLL